MQWKQQRESSKKIKTDRQLSGQSTGLTVFMKVSDIHKSSSSKKVVSLNMLERTDDRNDKLTSLVSKMNVKMRKHDTQFKHKYIRGKQGDKMDVITFKMTTGQK